MSGGSKEVTTGTTEPWEAAQPTLKLVLMGLVAALTLLSVAAYLAAWVRHMNSAMAKP